MIAQYASHFSRGGKFNENKLSWALQSYLNNQVTQKIWGGNNTGRGPNTPIPAHAYETFDILIQNLERLIDDIFRDTGNTPERIARFKEYVYKTVVMDEARILFGRGTRIRAFHGGGNAGPNINWKKEWIKKETLSRDRALLGVSATASTEEIKAHFRKLAKTAHPDVGGDPNKFLELKTAYDNLTRS